MSVHAQRAGDAARAAVVKHGYSLRVRFGNIEPRDTRERLTVCALAAAAKSSSKRAAWARVIDIISRGNSHANLMQDVECVAHCAVAADYAADEYAWEGSASAAADAHYIRDELVRWLTLTAGGM